MRSVLYLQDMNMFQYERHMGDTISFNQKLFDEIASTIIIIKDEHTALRLFFPYQRVASIFVITYILLFL